MKILQWATFTGACILGAAAIGFNFQENDDAKFAALSGGMALAIVSAWAEKKNEEPDQMQQMIQAARLDLFEQMLDRRCEQVYDTAVEVPALPPAAETYQNFYNWQDAPDDSVGVIICGNSGQGKSSIALWLLGLFTQQQPAIIKVLDPHKTINHWHEHGLEVIGKFEAIETELLRAVAELDRRRELSKKEIDRLPPFIYVADELGAMNKSFSDPEVVGTALSRLGCEGRKYNLSLIVVSHSKNVDKLGIDSNERDNYLVICLGGSARQIAVKTWGKKSPEYQHCLTTAYPCVVSGSVPEQAAIHPTHGHHTKFRKNGNAPSGLLPINHISALPESSPETNTKTAENERLPTPNEWVNYLNNMYKASPANPETSPEKISEIPENRKPSETDETYSGHLVSPFPKPDQDPADGCVRGGDWHRNEISLERASLVLKLKNQGKNQTEIILAVWAAKPGNNKAYTQAKAEFEAIKAHWHRMELW